MVVAFPRDADQTHSHSLSLHDALPISGKHTLVYSPEELKMLVSQSREAGVIEESERQIIERVFEFGDTTADRKSTRLNSSHPSISYAVFCLKKKTCTTHTHATMTNIAL